MWHRAALAAILGLAAFLDLFRLGRNGYANTYYSAAVRSMLGSWHNFLFASFDPGGLVSVDKPPLALWVEAASAKLFGYSGFAILLPEALAGVAAVGLLYLVVARPFGRVAGLVAALALAVSPVSVAVNRDNNPDALFALLLVASVYVGMRAVESGGWRPSSSPPGSSALPSTRRCWLAGLGRPGFDPCVCRLREAADASTALAARGRRRGARRRLGCVDRRGRADAGGRSSLRRQHRRQQCPQPCIRLQRHRAGDGSRGWNVHRRPRGGGLGGAFSGTPGVFRLLNDVLGDQGGWFLVLAIVGGLSAPARRRPAALTEPSSRHSPHSVAGSSRLR